MDRPHTRMDYVRLRAAERRAPWPADTVEALDRINDVYPDPRTRPAQAADTRERLLGQLHDKEG